MTEQSDTSEANSGQGKENGAQKKRWPAKRKWLLGGFTLLILLLGGAWAGYYFAVGQYYVSTDDAYVHGNKVAVMPEVSGTVTGIDVERTDFVKRGQLLAELDDTDANVALTQAKAQLAQTVREVAAMFAGADQQRAQIRMQRAALKLAEQNYHRSKVLAAKRAITPQAFDRRAAELDEARANLSAAEHELGVTEAKVAGVGVAANPQVKLAEAAVRRAYLNWQRTKIYAPISGYVARRPVEVGQQVTPQKALMVIVPLDSVWVDANFKETSLAKVRLDQPVTLKADLYGGDVTFHGKIDGFSPGTGASFELLPPQNATGNWIKVVRRLPVRIVLNKKELQKHPLYLGLSMTATVDVRDTSGRRLATGTPKRAGQRTDVYKNRIKGVQAIIERIVKNNERAGDGAAPASQPGG